MTTRNVESAGARLHVGVVTETYPPEANGVANTMRHLVEGLAARGHVVHLVRPRQPGRGGTSPPSNPGPRIQQTLVPGLPIPGYRGLRFGLPVFSRLRGLLRRHRLDVPYIATQGPWGHAALTVARLERVPTVTGFHRIERKTSNTYAQPIPRASMT